MIYCMIRLLGRMLEGLLKDDWLVIDAEKAVWTLGHGKLGGIEQYYCFYKIEYSASRNVYRLVTEGYRPKKHAKYGVMLKILASYNSGAPFDEDFMDDMQIDSDKIVITKFSLSYSAEKAFKHTVNDPALLEAISNIKKSLEKQGVEVYDQKENIIATERGYFGAFWESQLQTPTEDTDLDTENNE